MRTSTNRILIWMRRTADEWRISMRTSTNRIRKLVCDEYENSEWAKWEFVRVDNTYREVSATKIVFCRVLNLAVFLFMNVMKMR